MRFGTGSGRDRGWRNRLDRVRRKRLAVENLEQRRLLAVNLSAPGLANLVAGVPNQQVIFYAESDTGTDTVFGETFAMRAITPGLKVRDVDLNNTTVKLPELPLFANQAQTDLLTSDLTKSFSTSFTFTPLLVPTSPIPIASVTFDTSSILAGQTIFIDLFGVDGGGGDIRDTELLDSTETNVITDIGGFGNGIGDGTLSAVLQARGTIRGRFFSDTNMDGMFDEDGVNNILGDEDDEGPIEGAEAFIDLNGDDLFNLAEELTSDQVTVGGASVTQGTISHTATATGSVTFQQADLNASGSPAGAPAGFNGMITDVNVSIDLEHTFASDLTITLTSPAGTTITLMDDDAINAQFVAGETITFDDSAAVAIDGAPGTTDLNGTFRPQQSLSALIGEHVTNPAGGPGQWVLSISDSSSTDNGTLHSWSISVADQDRERKTTSDADGNYAITGLPFRGPHSNALIGSPGGAVTLIDPADAYHTKVLSLPPEFGQEQAVGDISDPDVDIDPSTRFHMVRIDAEDGPLALDNNKLGRDFAADPLAMVSGTVFEDLDSDGQRDFTDLDGDGLIDEDGDDNDINTTADNETFDEPGLAGVEVFLDINSNGLFEDGVDPVATTDADGKFTIIADLPTAAPSLNVFLRSSQDLAITKPEGTDNQPTTFQDHPITVLNLQNGMKVDIDDVASLDDDGLGTFVNKDQQNAFGVFVLGVIEGTAFFDTDGDRIDDLNEFGFNSDLNGFSNLLLLIDSEGNEVARTDPAGLSEQDGNTNNGPEPEGKFEFRGVMPGTYTIEVRDADLIGVLQTSPIGELTVVIDESGEVISGNAAKIGLTTDFNTITGQVVEDENGDGVITAGETNAVPGVTVELVRKSDGLVVDAKETNLAGLYTFFTPDNTFDVRIRETLGVIDTSLNRLNLGFEAGSRGFFFDEDESDGVQGASLETANFGIDPSEGARMLKLDTTPDAVEFDTLDLLNNFKRFTDQDIELFAQQNGADDGDLGTSTFGSAVEKFVQVEAGDTVEFDYNLLSNNDNVDPSDDVAMVKIVEIDDSGSTVSVELFPAFLASVENIPELDPDEQTATGFDNGTGFQSLSHTFASSGKFAISVLVIAEVPGNTSLLLDNFRLTEDPGDADPDLFDTNIRTVTVAGIGDGDLNTDTVLLLGTDALPAQPVGIEGRHIFLNDSSFDGNDPAVNALDDDAILGTKSPLFAGTSGHFNNYSNSTDGITGVLVDITNVDLLLTLEDFTFRVGNISDTASWSDAPLPTMTITLGGGVNGSDRITFTWGPGEVSGQWLEVALPSNAALDGISDTHYWGNAPGEIGDRGNLAVNNLLDALTTFNNFGNHPADPDGLGPLDPADDPRVDFDHNGDGNVNVLDALQSFNSQTAGILALQLIDLSPAGNQLPEVTLSGDQITAGTIFFDPTFFPLLEDLTEVDNDLLTVTLWTEDTDSELALQAADVNRRVTILDDPDTVGVDESGSLVPRDKVILRGRSADIREALGNLVYSAGSPVNDTIHISVEDPTITASLADPQIEDIPPVTDSMFILVDTIPPTINKIERLDPSEEFIDVNSVTFLLEFSEDITNIDVFDFTLGGPVTGSVVTVLTKVAFTEFEVGIASMLGEGLVDLDISALSNITDLAGNPLDTLFIPLEEMYVRDLTDPEVLAIDRQAPLTQDTNSGTVTFRVDFDEPVLNLDVGDFVLNPIGAALGADMAPGGGDDPVINSVTQVTPTQFDVTVIGLGASNGVLQLGVGGINTFGNIGSNDILDFADRPVASTVAGQTYIIDTVGVLTEIQRTVDNMFGSTIPAVIGQFNDPGSTISALGIEFFQQISPSFPLDPSVSTSADSLALGEISVSGDFSTAEAQLLNRQDLGTGEFTFDLRLNTGSITGPIDGDILLSVPGMVATDTAGNDNQASNTITINVDQTAPNVDDTQGTNGFDLLATSDTGSSQADDISNDTTPTIRVFLDNRVVSTLGGRGSHTVTEAGDTVELYMENLTAGGGRVLAASQVLTAANITNGFVDFVSVPVNAATTNDGRINVDAILFDQSVDVGGAANPNVTDTDILGTGDEFEFLLDTTIEPTSIGGEPILLLSDTTGGANTTGSTTDRITRIESPQFDTNMPLSTGGPDPAFPGSNQESVELLVDGVAVQITAGGTALIVDQTDAGNTVALDMIGVSLLGADGVHNIQTRTTDAAGNTVTTRILGDTDDDGNVDAGENFLVLDTVTSGTINVAGIANGIIGTAAGGETEPLVINGSAEVGSRVEVDINITPFGGGPTTTTTLPPFGPVPASGNWQISDNTAGGAPLNGMSFGDGDIVTFTLRVTDLVGNTFNSTTAGASIDTGATTSPGQAAVDAALADAQDDEEEELLALLAAGR